MATAYIEKQPRPRTRQKLAFLMYCLRICQKTLYIVLTVFLHYLNEYIQSHIAVVPLGSQNLEPHIWRNNIVLLLVIKIKNMYKKDGESENGTGEKEQLVHFSANKSFVTTRRCTLYLKSIVKRLVSGFFSV